uniref:Uncharacterized protein n=1 Tax=Opuntia streptacantha TaxID=393608 RepID=A0A7C9DB36_OPUST
MYSKYGLVDESVRVFHEMGSKDVVSWNALLSNSLRNGMPREGLEVFQEMRKERVEFTEFTLCSLLKACSHLKAVRLGMQAHGVVVTLGRDLVILATALIDFYSDVGLIDRAIKVYGCLNCRNDSVLHNSFIAACVKNRKYKDAFLIMSTMRPNIVALTSILAACSERSDLGVGKQMHCVALRLCFVDDTQLSNALLDMYAKCGKINQAHAVFDGIPHKDVVSWTSMIAAYGSHGRGHEAIDLFTKMEQDGNGVLPNDVTILAVLSACSHSGLVEQGRECFKSVEGKYGLIPSSAHYACFIDILGRAGHVEEVWCLYNEMIKKGTKPTAAVWAALLNACAQDNDVLRGEFAVKHLFALEPDKPGIYVLVSNFYAAIGKWDIVDQLRLEMKNKGLFKDMGNSWFSVCHNDIETNKFMKFVSE